MSLEARITELVGRSEEVTLAELGGVNEISDLDARSSLFPYVVEAVIAGWDDLDEQQRARALELIAIAMSEASSGVALHDTCARVIPAAPALEMTLRVKDALRARSAERSDQTSGGVAAIALRWLANLAVLDAEARPALADVLTGVARADNEPMPFALAAAQVAGLTYDHWRESAALGCLSRLVDTDGDADAWFALGQARLTDALEAQDRDSCVAQLRNSLECFDNASNSGEERADARMYGHAVRFVAEWSSGATSDMLDEHREGAKSALHEYMRLGEGLPGNPMWTRPRYEAETAWIELVQSMYTAASLDDGDGGWYEPAIALGALADVYSATNSLSWQDTGTGSPPPPGLELIVPRLTAPFVERSERLAFVDRWVRDSDEPYAPAFSQLLHDRLGEAVHPKASPPDGTRR